MTLPPPSSSDSSNSAPGAPPDAAVTTGSRRPRASRIDPNGKHALFSSPVKAAPDQIGPGNQKEGKHALYSTGPRQTGTVIVDCRACGVRTRSTLLDLGVRMASISLWIPGRKHSHWMRCPACHNHTWCRIGWTE